MSRDNATHHTHSPEQIELLARNGVVFDTRRNTIADPADFERKLPKWIAAILVLALGLGLWALIFWLVGWL